MPRPQMTRVRSSNVEEVGYDVENHELYIHFTSGETYAYSNVDPSLYEGLLSASSVGHYLNTFVKPNHAYSRL